MTTRRSCFALLIAIPMLLAAWSSAISAPCLMTNPMMADDGCDHVALCTPECGATCQPSFTVAQIDASSLAPARQSAVAFAVQTLTGIEIAPETPPPRS